MAYIEKRGEASYRLTVDLGTDAKGKRILKRKTLRIEDAALLRTTKRLRDHLDLELRKFQLELETETHITDDRIIFTDFLEIWFNRHVDVELEEKSRQNYRFHVKHRIKPFFQDFRIAQIKQNHIFEFIDFLRTPEASPRNKKLGTATIVYNYRILRSIFNCAIDWKVIQNNPMEGVKKPKEDEQKEIQFYDEHDIEALFNALKNERLKFQCVVSLAVMGGLRRGEIAGLEWHHVDLRNRTVDVQQSIPMNKDGQPVIKTPKTRKSRRKIAIPVLLVDMLENYKAIWKEERKHAKTKWSGNGEFLFCHESGQPHDPHWITDQWINFRNKHDLKKIRFHDLRHTAATWMIKSGVHPKAIANRLGHVNIKTTMDVYGHVMESVDQHAASVFDDMPTGNVSRGVLLGADWEQDLHPAPLSANKDKNGDS